MKTTYKGGFYTGMNDAARLDAMDAALAPKEGKSSATPDEYVKRLVKNSMDAQGTESINGTPEAIDRQKAADRNMLKSQLNKR